MAKFAPNNIKNASTGLMVFKLNCGYYSLILYKNDVNPCFMLKSADKLLAKLKKQIIIFKKTSIMLKNLGNKLIIKALNVRTISLIIKFD